MELKEGGDLEQGKVKAVSTKSNESVAFWIVTFMFFLWGIPNNLNDILIKQFMKSFEISRFEAGLTQSAFYFGYFVLSLPAGYVMRKYSYKMGLLIGLVLFGVGCLLFYPSAKSENYTYFLFSLFTIASGLSFLESISNVFIIASGPPETAEKRLNLAQAFNPLGCISGIIIGTLFILSGKELSPNEKSEMIKENTYNDYIKAEMMQVVRPYVFLGAFVLSLAVVIYKTKFPDFAERPDMPTESKLNDRQVFNDRTFLVGWISQFLYVGAQVSVWSYYLQYVQEYGKFNEKTAGGYLSATIIVFSAGRFITTYLMNFSRPGTILTLYSLISCILCIISGVFPSKSTIYVLGFVSFFMAPMFPTIFSLGLKNLGNKNLNVKFGGSVMVMAIIGGAILTPFVGYVTEKGGSIAVGMVVPGVCFGLISCFSLFVLSK